jgi:hypothetical protein
MVGFRCIRRGSQSRVHDPAPRFPPLAPAGGSSPASTVLSRRYDFLPSIPPHFVTFVWRYLSVPLVHFAPRRTSAPPRPGVGGPVLQPGSRRGDDRISQVPGEPPLSVCHVQSTPAGLLAADHDAAAASPLVWEQQRLPRKVFRRSIAWLSDWLSTLRRTGYPRTTPDSLSAAGQALPNGLSTRRVPTKGFRSASYISSSFPKLCLAQSHRPRHFQPDPPLIVGHSGMTVSFHQNPPNSRPPIDAHSFISLNL